MVVWDRFIVVFGGTRWMGFQILEKKRMVMKRMQMIQSSNINHWQKGDLGDQLVI